MSTLTHHSTQRVSALTLPEGALVNALTIAGMYTARLDGLAGSWAVHGHAVLWSVEPAGEDEHHVILQITDAPGPRRTGHSAYAEGRLTRLTDGRRQLVNPLTPQPGPTRITLGWKLQHRLDPTDAEYHVEQARAELAPWQSLPGEDAPLGVSALPHLARAAARAADGRAAEAERDALVRRLRAGGVPRDLVAEVDGRDPSRITQLCRTPARTSARVAG
ncbi:hypothetical protein ACFVXQ_00130 [Kitasatospora sp. NPDC058263]